MRIFRPMTGSIYFVHTSFNPASFLRRGPQAIGRFSRTVIGSDPEPSCRLRLALVGRPADVLAGVDSCDRVRVCSDLLIVFLEPPQGSAKPLQGFVRIG